VTSGGNNFNDFPDNQPTKFRVFIGWSRISTPPIFLWSICTLFPIVHLRAIVNKNQCETRRLVMSLVIHCT